MSRYVGEERDIIEKTITNAGNLISEYDFKQAYAQSLLGPNATDTEINQYIEEIDQLIKDDKLSMDTIKEYVISSAANQKAYEKVQENLNLISGFEGKAGYNTLKNIVASGGDASSYNALTETEADAFRELLANSDLNNIFNDESIFGEGFYEKLKNIFRDSEEQKAAYEQESQKNRDRIFNQKVENTASELGVDSDALESYTKYLQENNEELKNNRDAALDAAKANIKWNNGIENLSDVLSDNKDALLSANKGTWDYYEALGKVSKATSELLGIDVSADYVEEHLEDLKKAVEGDEEAIRNLQKTAAVDWAKSFVNDISDVEEKFTYLENGIEKTLSGFDSSTWADQFTNVIDDVANQLGSLDTSFTFEADASQPLNELVNLTNQALAAGQMTQAQMQSMFNSMGYSPEVTYIEAPGQSFTDRGTFTLGNPGDSFYREIPYVNSYTQNMMVPQIADKDASGSVSMTKITTPKSLGGSTKKSSGGGGGSSAKKKSSVDEKERYHVVTETLEQLEKEYDNIEKAKDRAFGKDKLDLMDQEIQKLEQLKNSQQDYVSEIERYYAADRGALEAIGGIIDPNTGVLLNYDQLVENAVNKFNNSGRTDSDEEAFDKTMKIIEQYEETHDLLMDENAKLDDYLNQITDAKLAKIEYELEVKIDLHDDELEYLEHLLKNIEDEAFSTAESIANLGKQTKEWLDKEKDYLNTLYQIFENAGMTNEQAQQFMNGQLSIQNLQDLNLTENEIKSLKDARSGLLDVNESLMELRNSAWDEVSEAIEETVDAFADQSEKVEHCTSVLDHYSNIIDIIGQEIAGVNDELMKMLNDEIFGTAVDQLSVSVSTLTTLQEERKDFQQKMAEADENDRKRWQDKIDELDKEIRTAEENMLSDWEDTLEAAANAFEKTVDTAVSNFEKAMSGSFGSFEMLQDAFNKQKELDDIYLDDYQKIYELTKLTRDINNSIDDSDNILGKQKLRDLQEEINKLQESEVELSEYDVNYLQKKYDLLVAQIALEEAQNAKDQVRMTRDSEGNWSYTYTADQDTIDQVAQDYEDKLYAMQELNAEYIKNTQEQIIDAITRISEEVAKLDPSDANYNQRLQEIAAYYDQLKTSWSGQMENALGNSKATYDFWNDYSIQTGYGVSANEDWIDSFDETTLSLLTGFETLEDFSQMFAESMGSPDKPGTLLGDLTNGYETWQSRVQLAMETAGTSLENFSDKTAETVKKVQDETNKAITDSENLEKTLVDNMKNTLDEMANWELTYGQKIDGVIDSNNKLIENLNALIAKEAELEAQNKKTSESNENILSKTKEGQNVRANTNNNKTYSQPDESSGSNNNNTKVVSDIVEGIVSGTTQGTMTRMVGAMGRILELDTGGYTGVWGSSGRLAMLHEKELVLNKDDTVNMLKSIDLIRDISNKINLNAQMSSIASFAATSYAGTSGINQNIVINADFPNATDRTEIKAAFDNLLNRASQYINRK